jgi:hypothetical protein
MIAEPRLCRDVQHILVCIRKLPAQDFSAETVRNYGRLDEFLAQKFGTKVDEWLTCTLGTDTCLQMFSGGKYGNGKCSKIWHNCCIQSCAGILWIHYLVTCCLFVVIEKKYIFENWEVNPGVPLMASLSILYRLSF